MTTDERDDPYFTYVFLDELGHTRMVSSLARSSAVTRPGLISAEAASILWADARIAPSIKPPLSICKHVVKPKFVLRPWRRDEPAPPVNYVLRGSHATIDQWYSKSHSGATCSL